MILLIIAVSVLSVSVFVVTYAYFTAVVDDAESEKVSRTSGSLTLILNDVDVHSLHTWNITPVDLFRTVYLSITNNSPIAVYAKLLFKGLTNTYSNDLVYTLEQVNQNKTSLSAPNMIKNQETLPTSLDSSKEEIANGLNIAAGETYYYKLTIEYLYSSTENQTGDINGYFYTGFDLEEGSAISSSSGPVQILSKAGSNLATGDKIAIGDQNFWVISNTNGTIRALAEYNMYIGGAFDNNNYKYTEISSSEEGYGLQSSIAIGYLEGETVTIAVTQFANVDTSSSYSTSLLKGYVEDYATLLNNTYGTNVTGDAITADEIKSLCNLTDFGTCDNTYPWVYTTSYWSRSALEIDGEEDMDFVCFVASDGDFGVDSYGNRACYGVRPVIVISESAFN